MFALVAGGGIAGTVTAIALRRIGVDVAVYEAADRASDGIGAFLTLGSNGLDALAALDLTDAVADLGFATPEMVLRDHQGRRLVAFPSGAPRPDGLQVRTLRRADLYLALRDEAEKAGRDRLRTPGRRRGEPAGRRRGALRHRRDGHRGPAGGCRRPRLPGPRRHRPESPAGPLHGSAQHRRERAPAGPRPLRRSGRRGQLLLRTAMLPGLVPRSRRGRLVVRQPPEPRRARPRSPAGDR